MYITMYYSVYFIDIVTHCIISNHRHCDTMNYITFQIKDIVLQCTFQIRDIVILQPSRNAESGYCY